jgi:hypothetical protein
LNTYGTGNGSKISKLNHEPAGRQAKIPEPRPGKGLSCFAAILPARNLQARPAPLATFFARFGIFMFRRLSLACAFLVSQQEPVNRL